MLLLALACTTEPEPVDDFVVPEAPVNGTQLHIGDIHLDPYEEIELCRYIQASNPEGGMVTAMELIAREGLHHAFVTKTPEALAETGKEEACFGLPESTMEDYTIVPEPLFASSTQVHEERIELPEGVGVEFGAEQYLVFNYHYLNPTDEPMDGDVYLNLEFAEAGAELEQANLYVFGNVNEVQIPAGEAKTVTTRCTFDKDVSVMSLTPHMHSLGTGFSVERNSTGELLLETEGWFNPETSYLDPALEMDQGDGFTFTCAWDNPGDDDVHFGAESSDEMCFLFGYHWPATEMYYQVNYNGCETL